MGLRWCRKSYRHASITHLSAKTVTARSSATERRAYDVSQSWHSRSEDVMVDHGTTMIFSLHGSIAAPGSGLETGCSAIGTGMLWSLNPDSVDSLAPVGGAMVRLSIGNRCRFSAVHFAARPLRGLRVLYSW